MRCLSAFVFVLVASTTTCKALAGAAGISDGTSQDLAFCTYECVNCTSRFYTTDANGACAVRSSSASNWFMYGDSCSTLPFDATIRDAATCNSITANDYYGSIGRFGLFGDYGVNFSDSRGCRAVVKNLYATGVEELETRTCFGVFSTSWALLNIIIFGIIGVVLGVLDGKYVRRPAEDGGDGAQDESPYIPGSKVVAKNNILSCRRATYLGFYRCTEIIAQLWVPAVILWVYCPYIVIPIIFLLYAVPAFLHAGWSSFSDPRFLCTPGYCGLLGIRKRDGQKGRRFWHLFFLIRPLALYGMTSATTGFIISASTAHWVPIRLTSSALSSISLNSAAIFHLAFQDRWGDLLALVVFWLTLVCSACYMALTIKPLFKSMVHWNSEDDYITFDGNDEQAEKFESMSRAIRDLAWTRVRLGSKKHLTAFDRRKQIDVNAKVEGLRSTEYSKSSAVLGYTLVVVDFLGYVYKVYSFLAEASYTLAGLMTMFLCIALTTVFMRGDQMFVVEAFHKTVTSGVPSRRFLHLIQCDDRVGIPNLFLSVFQLPLTRPTFSLGFIHSSFISLFFLLTGTKALAEYLSNMEDAGMYEVPNAPFVIDEVLDSVCMCKFNLEEDTSSSESEEQINA